jgi:hypothetical protein
MIAPPHFIVSQINTQPITMKVVWDSERNVWEVNFKKDGHRIKHYLENEDAASCLEDKQCIGLGIAFGQFL